MMGNVGVVAAEACVRLVGHVSWEDGPVPLGVPPCSCIHHRCHDAGHGTCPRLVHGAMLCRTRAGHGAMPKGHGAML